MWFQESRSKCVFGSTTGWFDVDSVSLNYHSSISHKMNLKCKTAIHVCQIQIAFRDLTCFRAKVSIKLGLCNNLWNKKTIGVNYETTDLCTDENFTKAMTATLCLIRNILFLQINARLFISLNTYYLHICAVLLKEIFYLATLPL